MHVCYACSSSFCSVSRYFESACVCMVYLVLYLKHLHVLTIKSILIHMFFFEVNMLSRKRRWICVEVVKLIYAFPTISYWYKFCSSSFPIKCVTDLFFQSFEHKNYIFIMYSISHQSVMLVKQEVNGTCFNKEMSWSFICIVRYSNQNSYDSSSFAQFAYHQLFK